MFDIFPDESKESFGYLDEDEIELPERGRGVRRSLDVRRPDPMDPMSPVDPDIASAEEVLGRAGPDPMRSFRREEQLVLSDPTDEFSEVRYL